MTRLAALHVALALALTGACREPSAPPAVRDHATTASTAGRAAPRPALATAAAIENLTDAPAEARDRVVATVAAIETNDSAKFLEMLSTSGFTTPTFALDAELVRRELEGRSVAELAMVPGCRPGTCQWSVASVDARRVAIAANQDGAELARVELMHDDDGSWTLVRALPR